MARVGWWWIACVLVAACGGRESRECEASGDCKQGGIPGTCRPSPTSTSQFCSYPDSTCTGPVGERWGVLAGDGLAETCVQDLPDAGPGDAPDAAPVPPVVIHHGNADFDAAIATRLSDGGVVLVGSFAGVIDLGGGDVTAPTKRDLFVARYGPGGQLIWSHVYSGTGDDGASGLAVDANDNVVFTAEVAGDVSFGGAALSAGAGSLVAVKLSDNGNHVWSRVVSAGDLYASVAIDEQGDAYLAGQFRGAAMVGNTSLQSAGGSDALIVKVAAATGNPLWVRQFGGVKDDAFAAVRVAGGRVTTLVASAGPIDFGVFKSTPLGFYDGFVLVLSTGGGSPVAVTPFAGGVSSYVSVGGLDMAADGGFVVCGYFTGTMNLGQLGPATMEDAFVARYDAAGQLAWSRQLSGAKNERCHAVRLDADGGVAFGGAFEGTVDFAGTVRSVAGEADGYVMRLSATNAVRGLSTFAGLGYDRVDQLVAGPRTLMKISYFEPFKFDDGTLAPHAGTWDWLVLISDD